MPILLIIFITKNKIFASEINNNGQADSISINGNPDIKCEGKESIDELIECIFEAFSIDNFGDEHFDIVIVDCGGNKNVIAYATEKCADADKLSIIGVEKLLPLIVWNKTQLQAGEEIVAAFDEACFKVACDDNNIVKFIGKARIGKENITLDMSDFSCLYYFDVGKMKGGVVDTKALQEKDDVIEKLLEEKDNLADALSSKEKSLATLEKQMQDAKEDIFALNAEKAKWEAEHPKPSDIVEQMVKVVEECKNEVDGNVRGDLYIKGTIPTKKIDSLIELYSKKFDVDIDRKSIAAIYYIHNFGNGIQSGAYTGDEYRFSSLLFTEDYFCYDTDYSKCAQIIYWKDLAYAFLDMTYRSGDDVITFKFNNGNIARAAVKKMGDDNITEKFLIPLLNKLKNVDTVE